MRLPRARLATLLLTLAPLMAGPALAQPSADRDRPRVQRGPASAAQRPARPPGRAAATAPARPAPRVAAPGREARRAALPLPPPAPPGRKAGAAGAALGVAVVAPALLPRPGATQPLPGEARELRRLAGPFRPAPAPSGEAAPCEERQRPVRNLEGFGYFLDPAFSRPDAARLAADETAAKPLRDWLALIQRALARHRQGQAGAAACALEAMDHWARNDALLGAFNLQGNYHRAWTLAGAALTFLALRDAPGLEPARVARVGRWLAAVARQVIPRHDRRSEALISDVRNNQAAWAGLAVMAAGVAAGDRSLLGWGAERLRNQLVQVDERGALPQELRRGAMALHYHLFALDAVAAMERLAAANGLALSEAERAAYQRLRGLALAAARDPARMQALAGVAQADPFLGEGEVPLARAPGLEIAAVAMPDPDSEAALAPFRPYASPWLGGEVTGWWLPDPRPAGDPAAPAGEEAPARPAEAAGAATPPAADVPSAAPPPPAP